MTALTADRNTPRLEGDMKQGPADAVKIFTASAGPCFMSPSSRGVFRSAVSAVIVSLLVGGMPLR